MLYFFDNDLTDDEDETTDNFSKFIKTQIQKNNELSQYLFDLGWFNESDTEFLEAIHLQNIYGLLTSNAKNTMKTNYMSELKKITNNNNFEIDR